MDSLNEVLFKVLFIFSKTTPDLLSSYVNQSLILMFHFKCFSNGILVFLRKHALKTVYHIYLKYFDILTPNYTSLKMWRSILLPVDVYKDRWMSGKQYWPWSAASNLGLCCLSVSMLRVNMVTVTCIDLNGIS